MFDLVRDVYGAAETKRAKSLIEMVQRSNPHLTNPSRILQGEEIFFPEVTHESTEAQQ